ncbi:hypothetical protein E4U43_004558 [Claviceps pusilla]|uniref:Uncharacterized protein n=1 Tax=Claviceps pusilla TaxID=123648 RepID=A0A9P7N3R5_9HYPO|nr:hypothetical protein E4U43_004558 [Claviceps pusilla]
MAGEEAVAETIVGVVGIGRLLLFSRQQSETKPTFKQATVPPAFETILKLDNIICTPARDDFSVYARLGNHGRRWAAVGSCGQLWAAVNSRDQP